MCAHVVNYLDRTFIAMAHRGGALYSANHGIENTVTAFRNAVNLGYHYLETDVHATKDGHLIAFHDFNLGRMTGLVRPLSGLTLREVQSIPLSHGERIPTIDELFETFPFARFNIDLKSRRAEGLLARSLVRHQAADRVCVGSFSTRRIRAFRKLAPGVVTSASPAAAAMLAAGKIVTRGDVYQVPLRHRLAGVIVNIVTPRTIGMAHAAGKKVHVWTINDVDTMHRLIDWGVDGIVTDRPDLLKSVLSMRGMWSTQ